MCVLYYKMSLRGMSRGLTRFCSAGESGYKMYIILKGVARVLKPPSPLHSPSVPPHPGECLPVDAASTLQPGSAFGEHSVLRAQPHDCSIYAGWPPLPPPPSPPPPPPCCILSLSHTHPNADVCGCSTLVITRSQCVVNTSATPRIPHACSLPTHAPRIKHEQQRCVI